MRGLVGGNRPGEHGPASFEEGELKQEFLSSLGRKGEGAGGSDTWLVCLSCCLEGIEAGKPVSWLRSHRRGGRQTLLFPTLT